MNSYFCRYRKDCMTVDAVSAGSALDLATEQFKPKRPTDIQVSLLSRAVHPQTPAKYKE